MHNVRLSEVDAVDRPVLAIGTDYLPGTLLDTHSHRRAQMLYGMSGLMEVETEVGAWVIPPYSGVWIPAGQPHRVRMQGVSTRSLYIEPDAVPRVSSQCEALIISPLLHHLLLASVEVPALYELNGRDGALMQLLLYEVGRAPAIPVFAPLPYDAVLAQHCRQFLHQPSIQSTPQDWADALHQSLRTFTRFFRQQTGMSFGEWRKQACLMAALARLSTGQSVTQIALDLGYESPAAFSAMFKKQLGRAPSTFMQSDSPV